MSGEIASDEPGAHNSAGGPGQLGPWAELAELTALARVSSQPLSPIPDDVLSEIRDFAETLRTLFGALGMSLNRLAAMLHSDPGTVSRYLSGKRVPPPDFIDALCKVVYDTKGSLVTPQVQELVHEQFLVALRVHNPARYEVQRLTDLLQAAAQQKRQYEVTVAALEEAIASRNDKIYALELESRQLRTAWARAERLLEEEREHRERLQHTIDSLYTEVGYFKEQLLSAQRRAAAAEERCQELEARLDSAGALLEDEEQRAAPEVTTGSPEAPETPALQPRDLSSDWAAAADSAVPGGGSAGARALGDTPRVRAGGIGVPVVWGDVPARNRNFTGREDVLHQLRASRGAAAVLPDDYPPMALQGLGGVGKTAVAVEYAHRYRTDYDLVWWIPADQTPIVRSSLASLADRLGLESAAVAGIDGAVAAALDALRRGEPFARWLLVFDNADQPEDIERYIPNGPGDVLITSRNHRWQSVMEVLRLDVFTRAESTEFLSKRAGIRLIASDGERLAETLGDLPLALAQAGAMLAETGMPVDEYQRLLDDEITAIMAERKSPDYPMSMTSAWKLSVATLSSRVPQATELLRVCAFFGPEPIPRDTLRAGPTLTSGISEILADPILTSRVVQELGRFALITIDNNSFSIHRLIQALVRDELTPDERSAYQHEAHLILAFAAPEAPTDSRTWPRYRRLLPHVASHATELERCPDTSVRDFALDVVNYLYLSGDLTSCQELTERLIEHWTRESGPDAPAVLRAHFHLGNTLRVVGRYPDAQRVTTAALTRAKQALGAQDPLALGLMNSAAADLRADGDFAAALSLDQENRDLHEQVLGPAHRQTLGVLNSLALDHGLNGDYREAKKLSMLAFSQAMSAIGMPASEILTAWNNLVWTLRLGGSFHEARDVAREAWEYGRESLGPAHYVTLQAGTELAIALRHVAVPDESLELAMMIAEQSGALFGDAHPVSIAATISLANSLAAAGQAPEAIPLIERAVSHHYEVYGTSHPLSHCCTGNLGLLRRLTGHASDARQPDETAFAGLQSRLGPQHFYTLTVAVNLASDLAMLGDQARACEVGEDTLARSRRALGDDHFLTLGCAANLALDLRGTGRQDKADHLATDTMNRLTRTLGPHHPQTTTAATRDRLNFSFDPPHI